MRDLYSREILLCCSDVHRASTQYTGRPCDVHGGGPLEVRGTIGESVPWLQGVYGGSQGVHTVHTTLS